ncbi:Major facilitator superfamily domain general substrate transporter [Penicillium herquei]|nr:Major facilitator superfamily domain general substrate transporter [Penicillium herquei]
MGHGGRIGRLIPKRFHRSKHSKSDEPHCESTVAHKPHSYSVDGDVSPAISLSGLRVLENNEKHDDLWSEAFEQLSDETQKKLGELLDRGQAKPNLEGAESIIEIVKQRQITWESRTWMVKFGEHEFVPKEYTSKIIECLSTAGDIGVQFLPQPASIVWPLVRGVPVNSEAEIGAALMTVEVVVRAISCGKTYQEIFQGKIPADLLKTLREALLRLYIASLDLLVLAGCQPDRRTAERLARAFLNPKETQEKLERLKDCIGNVSQVVEACQAKISVALDDKISDFLQKFSKFEDRVAESFDELFARMDANDLTKILDWISPIKAHDRHHSVKNSRTENTCEWLLQSPEFETWEMSNSSSVLRLEGLVGTGKTFSTSKVIDHLLENLHPQENLAFYYCRRNGTAGEKPDDIIRSLLRQLVTTSHHSDKVLKEVQTLYNAKGNTSSVLDIAAHRDLLVNSVNSYRRTTFVIDALDECDERKRKKLMDTINSLRSLSNPVRVFISTRPRDDVERHFHGDPIIENKCEGLETDIKDFILEKTADLPHWPRFSQSTQTEIINTLSEKSDGMFLWASLQIDQLALCMTSQDIIARIRGLPQDLEATYKEILDSISYHEALKNDVDRAFMWVLGSCTPPSNEELLSVISLGRDHDATSQQQKITKDDLLVYCHNLLIFDELTRSWRFSHASVVEYIEEYSWTSQDPNCYAAKLCLEFLSRTYSVGDAEDEEEFYLDISDTDIAFHGYCRDRWIYHVQQQEHLSDAHEFDPDLINLLKGFLGSPTEGGLAYQRWYRDFRQNGQKFLIWPVEIKDLDPPAMPILAMSRLSLDTILSDWWDDYVFSSSHKNFAHENPLILSARAGCTSICKRLIVKEAPINECGEQVSALEAAAYNDNLGVVQLLLDEGAAPDLLTSAGNVGSALAAAASNGNLEVAKLLLENGATPDLLLSTGIYGSALAAAAYSGCLEVAELLLENGATPNLLLSGGNCGSALAAAAFPGHLELVQLLLEKGAMPDLSLPVGWFGSALSATAYYGNVEVSQLLIDNGAVPDLLLSVGTYGSALATAACLGHLELARFLLENGATPNLLLPAGHFGSALAAAASLGQPQVVQLLLENGAVSDILLSTGDHGSALAAAAFYGRLEIAQLLFEKGATPNLLLSNGDHGSALAVAANKGKLNVVEFLVEKGADPDQLLPTGIYGSALVAAAAAGHVKVFEYLIHEAKADVNFSTGHYGRYGSPLAAAANMGNIKSVEILLRAGANPNLVLKNPCFDTALHASQGGLHPRDQKYVEFKVYALSFRDHGSKTHVDEAKVIISGILENLARLDELEGRAPGVLEDSEDDSGDNGEGSRDEDEDLVSLMNE